MSTTRADTTEPPLEGGSPDAPFETGEPEHANPLPKYPNTPIVPDGPGATKAASDLVQNYSPSSYEPIHISDIRGYDPDSGIDNTLPIPEEPPPEPEEPPPEEPSLAEQIRLKANRESPRAPEYTLASTPSPEVLLSRQSLQSEEAEQELIKEALKR